MADSSYTCSEQSTVFKLVSSLCYVHLKLMEHVCQLHANKKKLKKNSLLDAFTWITLIVQRNWANTPLWKWDPSNKTNLTLPVPDSALWSLGIKFVICYLTPETVFESFLLELALLLYNSFYCYCHHHGSTCLSLIFVVLMYPAQVFDIKEMLSQKVVKQTIALQRNYS